MAVTKPEKEFIADRASSTTGEVSNDDVEGGHALIRRRDSRSTDEKSDPFGDESNSEVKYRTMAWWSVSRLDAFDCVLIRKQASWNEYYPPLISDIHANLMLTPHQS